MTNLLARRFLYVIAISIGLVIVVGIGWSLFQDRLMRATFVPSVPFSPRAAGAEPDYAPAANWYARPDRVEDPSRWLPTGVKPTSATKVPVFYVAPTTYLGRDRWNAPIADDEAFARGRLFVATQASVFNAVGEIWAPRYRQATLGVFLTNAQDAGLALDLAYGDVSKAFDAFLAGIPNDAPFILAGHSQGSLLLTRLMADRIASRPLAARVIAAYPIGWPISSTADLPALGLPACDVPNQPGCIVAYQSFAAPADPRQIFAIYDATIGLAGQPRRSTHMLCVNPVQGARGTIAEPASASLGSILPSADFKTATLERGRVPAQCDTRGILLIGDPPTGYDRYILPGNNYHVFDYALFWADLRADVARRVVAYRKR